jgi:hypothetical protein
VDALPVAHLDLKLVCRGIRSAGYRQKLYPNVIIIVSTIYFLQTTSLLKMCTAGVCFDGL